jgi:hypothetical protein
MQRIKEDCRVAWRVDAEFSRLSLLLAEQRIGNRADCLSSKLRPHRNLDAALNVAMTMAGMTSTLSPVAAVCAPRQAAFGIGRDGGSVLR